MLWNRGGVSCETAFGKFPEADQVGMRWRAGRRIILRLGKNYMSDVLIKGRHWDQGADAGAGRQRAARAIAMAGKSALRILCSDYPIDKVGRIAIAARGHARMDAAIELDRAGRAAPAKPSAQLHRHASGR